MVLLQMCAAALFLFLSLASVHTASGAGAQQGDADDDKISSLPGLSFEPNFEHYSGYLQASPTRLLHYWLVTRAATTKTSRDEEVEGEKPLMFWFNGGPGCSSIEGLLNEMGPYEISEDGVTLHRNPYAWNKYASVVYIEAPAGVGYSYATDGNVTTNDDITAEQNYEAFKQFFTRHPDFRNSPVYIFGESYGGIYLPTLTALVVRGMKDFPVKLEGMAIGNGLVNDVLNTETSVRFAYAHGLVDEKAWNTLELECCQGCFDGCDLAGVSTACGKVVENILNSIWYGGLNPYDLYRTCDTDPRLNSFRMAAIRAGLFPRLLLQRPSPPPAPTLPNAIFSSSHSSHGFFPAAAKTTSKRRHPQQHGEQHRDRNLRAEPTVPCMNDTAVTMYMNSPAVRAALHIPESLGPWTICSDKISETYGRQYTDMSPFIKEILGAGVRILLYYGDTDMACNFMMGQQFSARLGLKRIAGKAPWKVGGQIAGFKTVYDRGLTFLTIRGAGHMAPEWRAPEMDYVVERFLLDQPI